MPATAAPPSPERRLRLDGRSAAIVLRSVVFNLAFYAIIVALMIAALPTLLMPRWGIIGFARFWARINLWLLRVVCDIRVEWRGLGSIPPGAALVAAKHQSTWETFALLTLLPDPTFILKRELMWIPLFGWLARAGEMVPVDRGAGKTATNAMLARAKFELGRGRQLVIFPEGTRRAPGAEPKYKFGVARLYRETAAPCVPIALNSGLFWPRRSFLRWPGTIRVEILPSIPPGENERVFFARLQEEIETATARLIDEAA